MNLLYQIPHQFMLGHFLLASQDALQVSTSHPLQEGMVELLWPPNTPHPQAATGPDQHRISPQCYILYPACSQMQGGAGEGGLRLLLHGPISSCQRLMS